MRSERKRERWTLWGMIINSQIWKMRQKKLFLIESAETSSISHNLSKAKKEINSKKSGVRKVVFLHNLYAKMTIKLLFVINKISTSEFHFSEIRKFDSIGKIKIFFVVRLYHALHTIYLWQFRFLHLLSQKQYLSAQNCHNYHNIIFYSKCLWSWKDI